MSQGRRVEKVVVIVYRWLFEESMEPELLPFEQVMLPEAQVPGPCFC